MPSIYSICLIDEKATLTDKIGCDVAIHATVTIQSCLLQRSVVVAMKCMYDKLLYAPFIRTTP